MWYFIGSFIIILIVAIIFYEFTSQNKMKLMYRYLRKVLGNENPYHIEYFKGEQMILHFNLDENNKIRGILYMSNERISQKENVYWHRSKKNFSEKIENLKISGKCFSKVYLCAKGMRYNTFLLGNDDLVFNTYMEDPHWDNAILKR